MAWIKSFYSLVTTDHDNQGLILFDSPFSIASMIQYHLWDIFETDIYIFSQSFSTLVNIGLKGICTYLVILQAGVEMETYVCIFGTTTGL